MSDALVTNVGLVRENNQDYITSFTKENNDKIYILCDGMGGYKGGEVASKDSCDYLKDEFKNASFSTLKELEEWLYISIRKVNTDILKKAKKSQELSNMGTTLICLVVTEKYKVYASVGDSRLYAYSDRELIQLSEDQTFTSALVKAGYISEKEALNHPKKGILLCAIGSSEEDLDIQIKEVSGHKNYLLCSDGLYNMLNNKEMLKVLNSDLDINERANKLIKMANDNGGKDNVSVILVEESL